MQSNDINNYNNRLITDLFNKKVNTQEELLVATRKINSLSSALVAVQNKRGTSFLGDSENSLFAELCGRIIVCGYCAPLECYESLGVTASKLKLISKEYFQGVSLTLAEEAIYKHYLLQIFKKRAGQVELTVEEQLLLGPCLLFAYSLDKIRLSSHMFRFDLRTYHKAFKLTRQGAYFGRFLSLFYGHPDHINRTQLNLELSNLIINKIAAFLCSSEFISHVDLEFDFLLTHSLFNLHHWLICNRLQDFKHSKTAQSLLNEMISLYKKQNEFTFSNIDTLRKISKFTKLHEKMEDQKIMFNWHFNVNDETARNPLIKIDALVWRDLFFMEIERYDDRVFRVADYIVQTYEYVSRLTLNDIFNLDFDFSFSRQSVNFKQKIEKLNGRLSEEELLLEQYSPFKIKRFSYFYEQDQQEAVKNAARSFVRYNELKEFNKIEGSMLSSAEKSDEFDGRLDEGLQERMQTIEEKSKLALEGFFTSKMLKTWRDKNLGTTLEDCRVENIQRKNKEYFDVRKITVGNEEIVRFSEKIIDEKLRKRLYVMRQHLNQNKQMAKESFIQGESRLYYRTANSYVKKKVKKSLVKSLFKV